MVQAGKGTHLFRLNFRYSGALDAARQRKEKDLLVQARSAHEQVRAVVRHLLVGLSDVRDRAEPRLARLLVVLVDRKSVV